MAVVTGAVVLSVLLGRLVVARLPEPADGAGQQGPLRRPGEHRVRGRLRVVSGAAVVSRWLAVPTGLQPLWWVLATFGVVLAAVDARTTWLPLRLTRLAWAAMAAAGLLALTARRGLAGAAPAPARGRAGRSALSGRLAALPRRVRLRRRALRPAGRRRRRRATPGRCWSGPCSPAACSARCTAWCRWSRRAGALTVRSRPCWPAPTSPAAPPSAEPLTPSPRGRTARRGRTRRPRPAPARCGRPGPGPLTVTT